MITDVNQTIRELMRVDGGIDPSEIDVSFEIPNREWSSRISKPTLNCYLFDVRERPDKREVGWTMERKANDTTRRQPPLRYGLTYLLTAWTRDVEDEHRLIWHTLHTLSRYVMLPEARLQGELRQAAERAGPVYTELARPETILKSPGEFWTALENHLKPSLSYTVNIPLDRDAVVAGPPVSSVRLLLQAPDSAESEAMEWIGGRVQTASGASIARAAIHVAGHHIHAITDPDGRYRLRGLAEGSHTLLINTAAGVTRHIITIPAADYTITLASDS